MRIAVHQPNYLPWCGFFHKMAGCDTFVLLDNVQYPRRDFCNRTRVRSKQGPYWLSLPVESGVYHQKIGETRLFEPEKNLARHFKTISHLYARAPFGNLIINMFEQIYRQPWNYLVPLNLALIKVLANVLGISTPLVLASSLGEPPGGKCSRIIYICQQVGADTYLSGRGAQAYNNPGAFAGAGIKLEYQDFKPPVYAAEEGNFLPGLSVIDLIAYQGPESSQLLKL